MARFKDRIKSMRRVPAADLIVNKKNPRTHGAEQMTAVRAAMSEVGLADVLLVRETDAGLELLDGHLRRDLAGDQKVPVLVIDITDSEADLVLATYDAVGEMADADEEAVTNLVDSIQVQAAPLEQLLESLAKDEVLEIAGSGEQYESDEKMKFRGWNLGMSPEVAELLNTKLTAYMDQNATCLGMAERFIQALKS